MVVAWKGRRSDFGYEYEAKRVVMLKQQQHRQSSKTQYEVPTTAKATCSTNTKRKQSSYPDAAALDEQHQRLRFGLDLTAASEIDSAAIHHRLTATPPTNSPLLRTTTTTIHTRPTPPLPASRHVPSLFLFLEQESKDVDHPAGLQRVTRGQLAHHQHRRPRSGLLDQLRQLHAAPIPRAGFRIRDSVDWAAG